MKYITIKDVAKRLNVSVSTVSRAFNDKYDIKKETRELILKTAKEMGYTPNPIAKKLLQKRSFNIGIVVPEFLSSFFSEVIIGVQEILTKKGYQLLVTQSNLDWKAERNNVKNLVENMVDGLIISLTSEIENNSYYKELIDSGMPIVFFNRIVDDLPASKVLFEDFKWSFFATEHLIVQGYKNIAHISGYKDLSLTKNRIKGFRAAHKKYKLKEGPIIYRGFTIKDGEEIAEELLAMEELPEAIFAANDSLAIGAMNVFKKNGIKIPEDIALVGFTESILAEHTSPSLTSVKQPTFEIGETTAQLIIEQIESKEKFFPQTIILNGRLNIRESSVNIK